MTQDEAQEIAALFGKGNLSEEQITQIWRQVRGWVAGLRLILQHPGTVDRRIDEIQERPLQYIFDFFTFEILQNNGKDLRRFLLITALLPIIRVDTASALTGLPQAGEILEDLVRKNYFTLRFDGSPPGYEYHPLFRRFLLEQQNTQLPQQELNRLLRATTDFLWAEDQREVAIDIIIRLQDWFQLSERLNQLAPELLIQGRYHTLDAWLSALSDATKESEPWLLYWHDVSRMPFSQNESGDYLGRVYGLFKERHEWLWCYSALISRLELFNLQWDDFSGLDFWLNELSDLRKHATLPPGTLQEARLLSLILATVAFTRPLYGDLPHWMKRAEHLFWTTTEPAVRFLIGPALGMAAGWQGDPEKFRVVVQSLDQDPLLRSVPPMDRLFVLIGRIQFQWMSGATTEAQENVKIGMDLSAQWGIHLLDALFLAQGSYAAGIAGDIKSQVDYLRRMRPCLHSNKRLDLAHYHFHAAWHAQLVGELLAAREHSRLSVKLCRQLSAGFPLMLCQITDATICLHLGDYDEALTEDYLRYRIGATAQVGEKITQAGIPIVRPAGGHAIYLDAKAFLPHVPPSDYPDWTLAVALYLEGGIRSCAIGSVMFGRQPDGREQPADMELVRLAFPRRVYTQSHMDYLVEVLAHVFGIRHRIRGVRIVYEPPALRHFTARFAPAHGDVIQQEETVNMTVEGHQGGIIKG